MDRPIVIGTRGSELAIWQANFVKGRLEERFPSEEFRIAKIRTTGDQIGEVALSRIGDKGLFTRQIETALVDGDIDVAVHSLKDLRTQLPDGLEIGAVCKREIPNDALVSKGSILLKDLPHGARVATGSSRRRSQLLQVRPDLIVEDIRGNVPTRLRKLDESELDALVLAYAGLERLGLADRIAEIIPVRIMVPAVGQGAIAVQIRKGDNVVGPMTTELDHAETRICITAERALLRRLEGGCQVPIAGYATVVGDEVVLEAFVGAIDGTTVLRESTSGPLSKAEAVGETLADKLLANGAAEILAANHAGAEI